LQQWLHEPVKELPSKDLLLVKLLNLKPDNVAILLDEIDRAIDKAEARGAVYRDIEKTYYSKQQLAALALEDIALYLALRKGIGSVAAHLKWLRETRAEIDARNPDKR
jgi:hypothetical protein